MIRLEGLGRDYGKFVALRDIPLRVKKKFTLCSRQMERARRVD
jgi:hypothetical protein